MIRLAIEADVGACLAIYAPIVRETAISFELEPPGRDEFAIRLLDETQSKLTLVSLMGERIAGYAYAKRFRGRPAYDWTVESSVYVHPAYQRRGVARSLYGGLLAGLRLLGYRTVIAGIALPNDPSERLHAALGFMRAGVTKNVGYKFGRWHSIAFWQYDLGEIASPEPPKPICSIGGSDEWSRVLKGL